MIMQMVLVEEGQGMRLEPRCVVACASLRAVVFVLSSRAEPARSWCMRYGVVEAWEGGIRYGRAGSSKNRDSLL